MALTSPDNIFSPDRSKVYALTDDLRQLTGTVQTALTRRANMYFGTSAERDSSTNLPNGVHWQDTDGSQLEHVKLLDSWVPVGGKFYAGTSAQRSSFTNAPEGSHWQDTNGSKLEYVRSSGGWEPVSRAPSKAGTLSKTTGTLTPPGDRDPTPGLYVTTFTLTVPVKLSSNERLEVTSLEVGPGYGWTSMVAQHGSGNSTNVSMRYFRVGSSSSVTLRLLWKTVPLG